MAHSRKIIDFEQYYYPLNIENNENRQIIYGAVYKPAASTYILLAHIYSFKSNGVDHKQNQMSKTRSCQVYIYRRHLLLACIILAYE